jgi:hypothetical protein
MGSGPSAVRRIVGLEKTGSGNLGNVDMRAGWAARARKPWLLFTVPD